MGKYEGFSLPKDIVMISTADWDETLWTNKQQIASRLVGDYRVLYVEPLKAMGSGKRGYAHKSWRDSCGVHVFRPPVALPMGNKFVQVNQINHNLVSVALRDYIGELGMEEYVLWIYAPNAAPYLRTLSPVLTCYDCVDEYSAFPGAWKGVTLRTEANLIRSVDVVFTTAETLYETKRRNNPNTHYIPNVGDFDHFHQAASMEPVRRIKDISKPIIGFVGAMNYKLDGRLLSELFGRYPEWSFVFIGPDRGFGIERYTDFPNVHFFGFKSVEELPGYMAGFDVCIIPYKVDNYTSGVMPIKFFEYLATGKPVVSTSIPEIARFGDLIDTAASMEEFGMAIERRLANDPPAKRDYRIELAKANSWETRIREILERLEETYRKKRLSK